MNDAKGNSTTKQDINIVTVIIIIIIVLVIGYWIGHAKGSYDPLYDNRNAHNLRDYNFRSFDDCNEKILDLLLDGNDMDDWYCYEIHNVDGRVIWKLEKN